MHIQISWLLLHCLLRQGLSCSAREGLSYLTPYLECPKNLKKPNLSMSWLQIRRGIYVKFFSFLYENMLWVLIRSAWPFVISPCKHRLWVPIGCILPILIRSISSFLISLWKNMLCVPIRSAWPVLMRSTSPFLISHWKHALGTH